MGLEEEIQEIIRNYNHELEKKYFHGDKRFSLSEEDYKLQGVSFLITPPKSALVSIHDTPYGIYLIGKENESAVTSFCLEQKTATIWQIQGIRGRYKELAPVKWHEALLNAMINLAQILDLEQIIMPTAINVRGYNEENAERLIRIYDTTAKRFQMSLTQDKKSYSLQI